MNSIELPAGRSAFDRDDALGGDSSDEAGASLDGVPLPSASVSQESLASAQTGVIAEWLAQASRPQHRH